MMGHSIAVHIGRVKGYHMRYRTKNVISSPPPLPSHCYTRLLYQHIDNQVSMVALWISYESYEPFRPWTPNPMVGSIGLPYAQLTALSDCSTFLDEKQGLH